jgi:hypothetical protein
MSVERQLTQSSTCSLDDLMRIAFGDDGDPHSSPFIKYLIDGANTRPGQARPCRPIPEQESLGRLPEGELRWKTSL